MKPARLADLPAIALLIARHFAPPLRAPWHQLYAAGLLPMSLVITAAAAGHVHHRDRRSALIITPRRSPTKIALYSIAALVALTLATTAITLTAPRDLMRITGLTLGALAGVITLSTALFIAARPPTSRRADRYTTDWKIQALYSSPGQHAILDAARLVHDIVQPGQSVGLIAANPRVAAIYRRYAFTAIRPDSLTLTLTRPPTPRTNPPKIQP